MKLSNRFLKRLRGMGLQISERAEIRRTRAGRHQRAAGAWSWWIHDPEYIGRTTGGYETVGQLLYCPNIRISTDLRIGDRSVECGCPGKCIARMTKDERRRKEIFR